jgi:hypothetical protein
MTRLTVLRRAHEPARHRGWLGEGMGSRGFVIDIADSVEQQQLFFEAGEARGRCSGCWCSCWGKLRRAVMMLRKPYSHKQNRPNLAATSSSFDGDCCKLTTENHASLDDLEDSLVGRPNVYIHAVVVRSCFMFPPFEDIPTQLAPLDSWRFSRPIA